MEKQAKKAPAQRNEGRAMGIHAKGVREKEGHAASVHGEVQVWAGVQYENVAAPRLREEAYQTTEGELNQTGGESSHRYRCHSQVPTLAVRE